MDQTNPKTFLDDEKLGLIADFLGQMFGEDAVAALSGTEGESSASGKKSLSRPRPILLPSRLAIRAGRGAVPSRPPRLAEPNRAESLFVRTKRIDNVYADPHTGESLTGGQWAERFADRIEEAVAKDTEPAHEFGCLLALLPEPLSKEITDWAIDHVPDCHLGPGGRESRPHVTLLYGFRNSSASTIVAVRSLLAGQGPLPVRLTGLSLFRSGYGKWKNEDGDVLKIDVESPQLHELNRMLRDAFDTEEKYPEYIPHVTVAFLDSSNPEMAESSLQASPPFLGRNILLDRLEFSGADGEREEIRLGLLPTLGEKALSWLNDGSGGAIVPPSRFPGTGRKLPVPLLRSKALPSAPSVPKKGTCEPGQRADLTGCVPASSNDPSQPPSARENRSTLHQSATTQALTAFADSAVAVAKKAGHYEHLAKTWAKDRIGERVAKLPPKTQIAVKAAWWGARVGIKYGPFVIYTAGQKAAELTARANGATPEQAQRIRGICAAIDLNTFEVFKVGSLLGIHAAHIPMAVTGLVPVASAGYVAGGLTYLAYSTASDPMKVVNSARKIIHNVARRMGLAKGLGRPDRQELLQQVWDFLHGMEGDADWRLALLMAGLDAAGDLPGALRLVREADGATESKGLEDYETKGFTGKRKDKLGRERCYQDGKLVPCGQKPTAPRIPSGKPESAGGNQGLPPESRSYLQGISDGEKGAISWYTGGGAWPLNYALNNGQELSEELKEYDNDLRKAFSRTVPLPQPVTVYRVPGGTSMGDLRQPLADQFRAAMEKNEPWVSKAYLSTSTSPKDTEQAMMSWEIEAVQGIDVDPLTRSETPEKEFLLNRNSRFAVLKMEQKPNGGLHVKLRQLPEGNTGQKSLPTPPHVQDMEERKLDEAFPPDRRMREDGWEEFLIDGQWLAGDQPDEDIETLGFGQKGGFTGTKKDRLGREFCWQGGKRVPCAGADTKPIVRKRERRQQEREKKEAELTERLSRPPRTTWVSPEGQAAVARAFAEGGVSHEDMPRLVGAPDGSEVNVSARYGLNSNSISINVNHPHIQNMSRSLSADKDGNLTMYNCMFFLDKSHRGSGMGMQVFSEEVRQCAALGVDRITTCAGKGGIMNGYYTWPTLGYDASLPGGFVKQGRFMKERLEPWTRKHDGKTRNAQPIEDAHQAWLKIKDAGSIQDLMETAEGREYWYRHGTMEGMAFDLTPGSRSLKVLNARLKAAGKEPIEPDPEKIRDIKERRKAALANWDAEARRKKDEEDTNTMRSYFRSSIADAGLDADELERRTDIQYQQLKDYQAAHPGKVFGTTDPVELQRSSWNRAAHTMIAERHRLRMASPEFADVRQSLEESLAKEGADVSRVRQRALSLPYAYQDAVAALGASYRAAAEEEVSSSWHAGAPEEEIELATEATEKSLPDGWLSKSMDNEEERLSLMADILIDSANCSNRGTKSLPPSRIGLKAWAERDHPRVGKGKPGGRTVRYG